MKGSRIIKNKKAGVPIVVTLIVFLVFVLCLLSIFYFLIKDDLNPDKIVDYDFNRVYYKKMLFDFYFKEIGKDVLEKMEMGEEDISEDDYSYGESDKIGFLKLDEADFRLKFSETALMYNEYAENLDFYYFSFYPEEKNKFTKVFEDIARGIEGAEIRQEGDKIIIRVNSVIEDEKSFVSVGEGLEIKSKKGIIFVSYSFSEEYVFIVSPHEC
jgi:hypothetical protein